MGQPQSTRKVILVTLTGEFVVDCDDAETSQCLAIWDLSKQLTGIPGESMYRFSPYLNGFLAYQLPLGLTQVFVNESSKSYVVIQRGSDSVTIIQKSEYEFWLTHNGSIIPPDQALTILTDCVNDYKQIADAAEANK